MGHKKIDKEFCITDESVNVYGYRLLTSGLMLDRFKPAIGFLMHDRDKGVAVRWTDFRTEGDKVYAKPMVNENRFGSLRQEIEDGYYSAASVGSIVAIELSNDEKLKIEGQKGPTVTKWFPREVSIVDIPGNYNAVAEDPNDLKYDSTFVAFSGLRQLFDDSGRMLLDLVDYNNKINTNQNRKEMEKTFKLEDLKLPGATGEMTITQVNDVIADLVQRAAKADANAQELQALKDSVAKERVASILKKGMDDRKLTKELADKLGNDYAASPDALQSLIDAMPAQTLHTQEQTTPQVPEKYVGKSYNDLYLSGELEDVKSNYPDLYATLKKQ